MTKMKIHENDDIAIQIYKDKVVKTDHKILSIELNLDIHKEMRHEKV